MADKRLFNDVAAKILEMIDSGQFPPGSRLPAERELAEQLGVSRVTVREAQIALQAKERIEVRTGSGAHVLAPKQDASALPEVEAFELTQARSLFESEAAALAATVISDDEIERLESILARMDEDTSPHSPLAETADREFHMGIAAACGNRAIVDTIERLWRLRSELPGVKKAYDSICEVNPTQRFDEHSAVLEALKKRDPVGARQAMRHHFSCIMEAMLETQEQAAIEEARQRTMKSRERFLETARLTG